MVSLTLVFRYPLAVSHELGSDTSFIHSLTDSLVTQGRALWILNPLSYFGLYALSYPSAAPFLFASLSDMAGIPAEPVVLFVGFVFAIVGCLATFTAARLIRNDLRFVILATLLFSLAPYYIKETTWMGSSRGLVTALVPGLFLLLLLHLRTRDPRYLVLAVLLAALMGTVHRMGLFAAFILIAYLLATPFHKLTQQLRFAYLKRETSYRYATFGTAVAALVFLFSAQFVFPGLAGSDVFEQYQTGTLFSGSSVPVLVTNMAISLTGKFGLLLPLLVLGIPTWCWKRPKEPKDKFILVTIFLTIPLLSLRDYVAEFLVFVFAVQVAFALLPRTTKLPRRKIQAVAVIAVLTVSTMAFAWVMKDYWREQYYNDGPIPDDLYATALYVQHDTAGSIISNEGMSAGRIAAIANRPVFPIGGASDHWYGPQQLTFGLVDATGIQVQQLPLSDITFQTDWIFNPVNVRNAKDDYEIIFYNDYGSPAGTRLLVMYGIHYLVLMNSKPAEFQSYIWRSSPFVVQTQQVTYRTFDSGLNSLWYLG